MLRLRMLLNLLSYDTLFFHADRSGMAGHALVYTANLNRSE